MKRLFISLVCSILALSINAQDSIPHSFTKGLNFRNIGPAGMSGRITAIKIDPRNENLIYVGSASGGLWKSTNGGQTWKALFQNEKVSSIGSIALDPQNPDKVWVGTGEGNPRNSLTSGYGIYKSLDGGETWESAGLEETRNIHRIIIHPFNPETIYVAAIGTPWGDSEHRGVYKSIDGGLSWNKILYTDQKTGAAELVMDPNNPDKLMVSMWEHRREPWFFTSGGSSSGLHITNDGGKNWEKRGEKNGLPSGDFGRIGLAIAASNSNICYALVEHKGDNAFYQSKDGGNEWKKMSSADNIGNRPFYYSEIYVDPKNESRVFSLWSILTKTENGGKDWEVVSSYNQLHPDHQSFYIHPEKTNYILEGNDGGLNISRDGGKTWRFVNNLPIAQYYHINYDLETPYNVYGGMQDNGSWKGPAYIWENDNIRNRHFQELYFGDGFDVMPDPSDADYAYAMAQEGYVAHINTKTGETRNIRPVHPEGKRLRFNWNAPIAYDPFGDAIFFGAQYVFKSLDKGKTWIPISDDLTTNDTNFQKFDQTGGLTFDVTGAENFTTLLCIAPDLKAKDIIWASSDDGLLHLTKDGGENWQELSSNLKGAPKGAWIPQVVPSPHKKGAAFVVVNDYRRNHWDSYLYYTNNYGKSFKRLVNPEKIWGYSISIVQDPIQENLLFLGTNNGLYFSWNFGENWQKFDKQFPTVPVSDLKIHPREGDLIVGTFGRSAWILDNIEPLRQLASKADLLEEKLLLFKPNPAVMANYKAVNGMRFPANAEFSGQNRSRYPELKYWVNFSKDDSIKTKKAVVHIIDEEGDTIKTLRPKFENGMNSFSWYLSSKGKGFPSKNSSINDTTEGNSSRILSGNYQIELQIANEKVSTMLEVQSDPRSPYNREKRKEKIQFMDSVNASLEGLRQQVNEIKLIEAKIGLMKKMIGIANQPKDFKSLSDSIVAVQKSIIHIYETLYGKEVEGYYNNDACLSNRFYAAMRYSNANDESISESELILLKKYNESYEDFLKQYNKLIDKDWNSLNASYKESGLGEF